MPWTIVERPTAMYGATGVRSLMARMLRRDGRALAQHRPARQVDAREQEPQGRDDGQQPEIDHRDERGSERDGTDVGDRRERLARRCGPPEQVARRAPL